MAIWFSRGRSSRKPGGSRASTTMSPGFGCLSSTLIGGVLLSVARYIALGIDTDGRYVFRLDSSAGLRSIISPSLSVPHLLASVAASSQLLAVLVQKAKLCFGGGGGQAGYCH